MDVAFRVDASNRIGSGHVMRCLNLARGLRNRGAQARFICRAHPGHLMRLLEQNGMRVMPLSAADTASGGENHGAWLGTSTAQDAGETVRALSGRKPDWLVADHYGLDVDWERRVRPHVGRMMLIDDLADRLHECDVLLDQNYHEAGQQRYARLVPPACKLVIGPRYALLGPEFAGTRRSLPARSGRVTRVLVFFGGSDPLNATKLALDALSDGAARPAEIDVVVGANYAHGSSLEKLLASWPGARIHRNLPHLAELLKRADIAVGAGGTTTWERMCLGVPTVVVSIAANQHSSCESLAKAGLIEYAGPLESTDSSRLRQIIETFVADSTRRAAFSVRGMALVDGLGVSRVLDVLMPS